MRTLIGLPLALLLVTPFPDAAAGTGSGRHTPGPDGAVLPALQTASLPDGGMSVYLLDEDFDGAFPPPGWTVINPDGGRTWERTATASGYGAGAASARMRFYDYTPNAGQADSLLSPAITGLTASDSISFDYALVPIPSATVGPDTVEVHLSLDGGLTFPTLLATLTTPDSTGAGTISPFVPEPYEWGTRRWLLPPEAEGAQVRLLFLARNHFGQNFYLDNVRAGTQAASDVAPVSQNSPPLNGAVIETFPFVPAAGFRNLGTAPPPTPFNVRFEILDTAGLPLYTSTTIIDTLLPGNQTTVTFDTVTGGVPAGRYTTRIIALLPADEVPTNDTLRGAFTADLYVRTLPYWTSFEETDDNGWSGRSVSGSRTDWTRGTPAKPLQIQSAYDGTSAWVTGLSADYQNNQNSALYSPYFDFTHAAPETRLEFRHNFAIESGFDGAVLEYSTTGGSTWRRADSTLGSGPDFDTPNSTKWYNSSNSSGVPNPPKWSGSSTTYPSNNGGWIRSTTGVGILAGQPLVRFRWRIRTDESETDEGWAVDAVRILPDSLEFVPLELAAGWNFVSNPVRTAQDSLLSIFPGSLLPFAYTFSGTSGYTPAVRLPQGFGGFVKAGSPSFGGVIGTPVWEDTLQIPPGWSIIGSISAEVAFDSIQQVPPGHVTSPYYTYAAGTGYQTPPSLLPGQAAWVKSTGGTLIRRVAPGPADRPATGTPGGPFLLVQDASGSGQMLAVRPGTHTELPPPPPGGAFHARPVPPRGSAPRRFAYGFARSPVRFLLSFGEPADPGPIALRMSDGGTLTLEPGKEVLVEIPTSGWFEIVSVSHESIPATYWISTGYPNPFNPEARLEFGIPVTSVVRLELYDLLGRRVQSGAERVYAPGVFVHQVDGSGLASGTYFVQFTALAVGTGGSFSTTRRLVLVK